MFCWARAYFIKFIRKCYFVGWFPLFIIFFWSPVCEKSQCNVIQQIKKKEIRLMLNPFWICKR